MDSLLRDENIEIYDWNTGGLAGLEESLDDFNEDTFDVGDIGKDFDFAGNTSSFLGVPAASAPAPSASGNKAAGSATNATRPSVSPFGSFGADPLLGPVRSNSQQQNARPGSGAPAGRQYQQYSPLPTSSPGPVQGGYLAQQQQQRPPVQQSQKPQYRTLEEIEAELQNNARAEPSPQQQQQQQQRYAPSMQGASPAMQARPPLPQSQSSQARTIEEIEVEMMQRFQAQQIQSQPQIQGAPPGLSGPPGLSAPSLPGQGLPPQTQNQVQAQTVLDQLFPALPGQAPSQGAAGNGGLSLSDPHLASSIEERIKSHEAAELARRRKANKIHRMAKYNNLMTQGDKDFITRIQVSQLINTHGINGQHDPYFDDFYFEVMRSLKQGRMQAVQQAQQQQQQQQGEAGNTNGNTAPRQAEQQQNQPRNMQNQGNNRMGRQGQENKRLMTRRENAMNRMAQQVQRIVDDAKKKPRATQLSLEGALGKIAIRTRSAPRPLLQVDNKKGTEEGTVLSASATSAANNLSASLNQSSAPSKAALNRRQVLIALEYVYDLVLQLEQSRRVMLSLTTAAQAELAAEESQRSTGLPSGEIPNRARTMLAEHEVEYGALVEKMWKGMKVMEPLDIAVPHPFIALLSATKGKKLLPRVLRHTNNQQTLTLLTLLVATFDTLDVVQEAPILDTNPNDPMFLHALAGPQRRTRKQVEMETETFLNVAIPLVMGTIGRAQLRIVTGMLGLLIERNDLIKLAKTKPGLAFLTVFLSRGQILKETTTASSDNPVADSGEIDQWNATFNHLCSRLTGNLTSLFPSTRAVPFGPGLYTQRQSAQAESILDAEDEPVWHFLAALAVLSDMNQQQSLVTEVRDKVLENVMKAKTAAANANAAQGQTGAGEAVAQAKIRNVNTFLHALGLDASQIQVE